MRGKLGLDLNALAVESFPTGTAAVAARGTVRAHQPPCTCDASCACPSAPYWCADVAYTVLSCDYTKNESCWHTVQTCTPA